MRTFAHKPKATTQRAASASATMPSRAKTTRFSHDFGRIAVEAPSSGPTRAEPAAMDGVLSESVPLRSGVRAAMEASFGEALTEVRLHGGPAAHRSARALGARAYTAGNDIVLGDQVSMAEVNDVHSHLLTHELTHVLQHRRAGKQGITDRIAPSGGAAEREAQRNSWLSTHRLPLSPVQTRTDAVALTPTSARVEHDLSYALNDWMVTEEEETRIISALGSDADLSATVTDLHASGMLGALFDRIGEPGNRRRLLHILGGGLNAGAQAIVEPHVRRLGSGAELQYNLGRLGVVSAAPAFNPAPLEAAVVGTARTSRTGFNGGFLTDPFTGVGATGVIPTTRYVGTFHTTPGVPRYADRLPGSGLLYVATVAAWDRGVSVSSAVQASHAAPSRRWTARSRICPRAAGSTAASGGGGTSGMVTGRGRGSAAGVVWPWHAGAARMLHASRWPARRARRRAIDM